MSSVLRSEDAWIKSEMLGKTFAPIPISVYQKKWFFCVDHNRRVFCERFTNFSCKHLVTYCGILVLCIEVSSRRLPFCCLFLMHEIDSFSVIKNTKHSQEKLTTIHDFVSSSSLSKGFSSLNRKWQSVFQQHVRKSFTQIHLPKAKHVKSSRPVTFRTSSTFFTVIFSGSSFSSLAKSVVLLSSQSE